MDRLTQRFLSACALGAGLTVFLWFLFGAGPGALAVAAALGGFAGYVLVDVKAFVAAVPEAWRFAKRGTRAVGTEIIAFLRVPYVLFYVWAAAMAGAIAFGFQRNADWFAILGMSFVGSIVVVGGWLWLTVILLHVDHAVAPDRSLVRRWSGRCRGDAPYRVTFFDLGAHRLSDGLAGAENITWSQSLRIHAELLLFVPIVRLPVWIVKSAVGIAVGAFSLAYLLVTELFRLVHNDLRTACLVDSVLGGTLVALQAMLMGEPDRLSIGVKLMCVAAGALFGLGFGGISYYVFTESKRRMAS